MNAMLSTVIKNRQKTLRNPSGWLWAERFTLPEEVYKSVGGVVQSAAVVQLLDYYPYGGSRINEKSGNFDEVRKFAGYERDDSTGLDYIGARYYDSADAGFISQDPAFWDFSHLKTQLADPQSWNSYAYARNNPLIFRDPNGQFWAEFARGDYNGYNPMNVLFGADTNSMANNIKSGNYWGAAGDAGNIALTTGLTILTAWDVANVAGDATLAYRANSRYQAYQEELQNIEAKSAQRYVNNLVNSIDEHGSYEKHVLGINNPNGGEYGSLFQSKDQWNGYVSNVISKPSASFSGPTKDLYWDDSLGTIVINNKAGGAPTAFKPQQGYQYYQSEVAKQQEIINKGVK